MFVLCACGRRHWGRYGAAGLLLTDVARSAVLLQRRSVSVHHGGTWACMGGAIEPGESPVEAAMREAVEEEDLDPSLVRPVDVIPGLQHPDWRYTYVLAETDRAERGLLGESWSWESDGTAWFGLDDVAAQRLHPELRRDWPSLLEAIRGSRTR